MIEGFEVDNVEEMLIFYFSSLVQQFKPLLEFLFWLDDNFPEHELFSSFFVTNQQIVIFVLWYDCVFLFIFSVGTYLFLTHSSTLRFRLVRLDCSFDICGERWIFIKMDAVFEYFIFNFNFNFCNFNLPLPIIID